MILSEKRETIKLEHKATGLICDICGQEIRFNDTYKRIYCVEYKNCDDDIKTCCCLKCAKECALKIINELECLYSVADDRPDEEFYLSIETDYIKENSNVNRYFDD